MGATDTDTVTVTVVDTTPPVVTLRMSPDRLWPPNHKMKTVQAILDIQDCDPAPTVELVSVTSNEPDNGLGDGDTAATLPARASARTTVSVQVRAERSGTGSGRVYTFVYRVTDAPATSRTPPRRSPCRTTTSRPTRERRRGGRVTGRPAFFVPLDSICDNTYLLVQIGVTTYN